MKFNARLSTLLATFGIAVIFAFTHFSLNSAVDEPYRKEIKLTPLLKTQTDSMGNKLFYPTNKNAEVTAVLVEIPPGTQTGWHKHPVPCFAYMLEGELQIEMPSGEIKTVKAGQAFAEAVNVLHSGTNAGPATARLVMFAIGVDSEPYAVRPLPEIPRKD